MLPILIAEVSSLQVSWSYMLVCPFMVLTHHIAKLISVEITVYFDAGNKLQVIMDNREENHFQFCPIRYNSHLKKFQTNVVDIIKLCSLFHMPVVCMLMQLVFFLVCIIEENQYNRHMELKFTPHLLLYTVNIIFV
jgi:hypothetical protein